MFLIGGSQLNVAFVVESLASKAYEAFSLSKSGLMTKMGRTRFSHLTQQEVIALKAYLDTR